MKVTIFALHLGVGGVEKYVATIANMLSEKHQVQIISTYKTTEKPAFYINDKVAVQYLIPYGPNGAEFKIAIKKKKFLRILKEGMKSVKILCLKRYRNIKTIKSQDCDVVISTRIFHNYLIQKYAKPDIVKITTEHNHHNNNEKYIRQVCKSCKNFDYLLPISRELTEFYAKRLDKTKVLYIPFCIEQPVKYKRKSSDVYQFVTVGRLSPEKGILDLVDIFEEILKILPNAYLHIVGDGEEYKKIQAKIEYKNLENKVCMHGYMKKECIDELYAQCDVYLMTSYTESFGFVLLEAMACGIPCVAFDSAQGAKEIIENNNNGFLIANRNKEKFIDKAVTLVRDKQRWIQMSEKAKYSVQTYSYSNTKEKWLQLFDEIKGK